jgi:hypothetical protein
MDSLAQNGARFERAYCVNPVCVPSRTGMFTGYALDDEWIRLFASGRGHCSRRFDC